MDMCTMGHVNYASEQEFRQFKGGIEQVKYSKEQQRKNKEQTARTLLSQQHWNEL
jgi:hypothetical protein